MSSVATIECLSHHVGEEVTLQGWLYHSRDSGKLVFLIVRDGTGLCQCVLERRPETEAFFEDARRLPQESSLRVRGIVRAEPRAPGGHELHVTGVEVVHRAQPYPITPKPHGVDFLMKHRHLWLRSRRQVIIARIRHTLVDAIRRFFNDRGFVLVDTPIFAPSAGEGTTTLFCVDYFGEPVYLAQTGQLYVEAACMALGRVYCFGPTFRAEKSKTRRHLTEFWMVEPEVAFCDLDGIMEIAEEFVCEIVQRILERHRKDLEELGRDPGPLENVRRPFYRLTYQQTIDLLHSERAEELLRRDLETMTARIDELRRTLPDLERQREQAKKKWQQEKLTRQIHEVREELAELEEHVSHIPEHLRLAREFTWGKDLGGSDETIVARLHDRPVFVTHYPREVKAFYMKLNPDDPRLVNNFDLLAPEGYGEIIGGSQREDDYDTLLARIREEGLPVEPYEWYLDLRRYGSVPHAGFGLGVERTLAWICGLKHVRETIAFPRMMGRLYP